MITTATRMRRGVTAFTVAVLALVLVVTMPSPKVTGVPAAAAAAGATPQTIHIATVSPTPYAYPGASLQITVSWGSAIPFPTGTVTFNVDGTNITEPISSTGTYAVTMPYPVPVSNNYSIYASYAGDATYTPCNSNTITVPVQIASTGTAATITSVTPTYNPMVASQPITICAGVTLPGTPGEGLGDVVFYDGTGASPPQLGVQQLSTTTPPLCPPPAGGQYEAALTLGATTLAVGPHQLTAKYVGDNVNPPSPMSVPTSEQVNAELGVTGPAASTPGAAATYTATFGATTPALAAPTGSMTFAIDGNAAVCTPAPVITSTTPYQASCATTLPVPAGPAWTIVASYSGDSTWPATSTSVGTTNSPGTTPTSTSLASTPNPSAWNTGFTLTATVARAAGAGTPTGLVEFFDNTTSLGSAALSAAAGSNTATLTVTSFKPGTYTALTAKYLGDATYATSTSTAITQTVSQGTFKSFGVTSSVNPAVPHQSITYSATWTTSAAYALAPTGTITFTNGPFGTGAVLCTLTVSATTTQPVTCSNAPATAGTQNITVHFATDANYAAPADAALTETINAATTTTGLSSSANPATPNQSVTYTATVSVSPPGVGTPTGAVNFADGGVAITGCQGVALFGNTATCAQTYTAISTHAITASYTSSNGNFANSASPTLTETVQGFPPSISVISSPAPSVYGQSVTFTATVTSTAASISGTVTFTDGTIQSSAITLSGGSAQWTTAQLPGGSQVVTVSYSGDSTTAGGMVTYTQTVNTATTTTTVSASPAAVAVGQQTTYSATVTASAPSTATPVGTVTFRDGATAISGCTNVALSAAGGAICQQTYSVPGTHSVVVDFTPTTTTNFSSSTSATAASVTVNSGTTTTTIADPTAPTVTGQPFTLTANVTIASGSGALTGTVTFKNNGAAITGCTNLPLPNPQCPFTSGFGAGSYPFTATYNGDPSFTGSTSATDTHTVSKAATSAQVAAAPANPAVGQSVTLTATITVTSPGAGNAGGTISFYDSSTLLTCPGTVSTNQATCVTTFATAGPHSITVQYNGDANFAASPMSPALAVSVAAATTSTSLAASPVSPATYGTAVTLTATIGGGTSPTGTVKFYDSTTLLGSGPVSAGSATYTTSGGQLGGGGHSLSAVYGGDTNNSTSTSSTLTYTVNPALPTVTVTSSANPSVSGQTVTFTVTVSPPAAGLVTPTGTVTFTDSAALLPASCTGQTLGPAGTAQCSLTYAVPATDTITASYGGDANYASATSAGLTQTVNKAATTTTLTTSGSPSTAGATVTYTATIAPSAPGAGTPSGTVTFSESGATLTSCTQALGAGGTAQCTQTYTTVGTHQITAAYSGDGSFTASGSAALTQTVNPAQPTLTVTGNPSTSSVYGQSVTFTATFTGSSAPTGQVTFADGVTTIGTGTIGGTTAQFTTATLAAGAHSITAHYAGDANNLSTTSPTLSYSVTQAAVSIQLTASPTSSVTGQAVTFTATLTTTPSGLGVPGTVSFTANGTTLCGAASISGNVATCPWTFTSAGSYTVTAAYAGSANFAATSTSAPYAVGSAATTITVASTPAPTAVVGQTVTYTATLGVTAPGAGSPTGQITFYDGGVQICTPITVPSASYTCAQTYSAVGSHSVTAGYSGNASFSASTSSPAGLNVVRASTSTMVSASPATPVFGQGVTITATIAATAPGGGTVATGDTVTFFDGATQIGTAPTGAGGTATFTTAGLGVATHTIGASFGGDTNYASSSGSTQVTVTRASTSTALTSSNATSTYGQAITYTANVAAVAPGAGSVGGTATFYDNSTAITACTGVTVTTGVATCAQTPPAGSHSIQVQYLGDTNFAASTSPVLTQAVAKATTTTAVTMTPVSPSVGQVVTFTITVSSPTAAPDGSISVTDNGAPLCTAVLSGGTAPCTRTYTTSGSHNVDASYGGTSNFLASTSSTLTFGVGTAGSTTVVSTSATPVTYGTAITFTATVTPVSPATNTATGNVTFNDGATVLGVAAVNASGVATFTPPAPLAVGTHSIVGAYAGDASLSPSSGSVSQSVTQASTTINPFTVSPATSAYGTAVSFTATVNGVSGGISPAGSVTFSEGGTVLGSATLSGASGAATATFTMTGLAVGTHSISASYGGNATYTSSAAGPVTATVTQASTTTSTPTSSLNPSSYGQSVSFTATVSGVSPTGSVSFYSGGTLLGSATLSGGSATFATSALAAGSRSITATYGGDTNNASSSSTALTQTVNQAASATVLSGPSGSTYGQSVVFTAAVSGAGVTPGGSVTFLDGATAMGTVALTSGSASFATPGLSPGTHSITASYGGDANHAASTSGVLGVTVARATPTLSATGSAPSPSTYAQAVTFSLSVTSSLSPAPTGTVSFVSGSTVLCSATLVSGTATCSYSGFVPGSYSVSAQYSGDSTYVPATAAAITQTVTPAAPTVTLSVNPSAIVYGQTTSLTATVSGAGGTPTGSVEFKDGMVVQTTIALINGTATWNPSSLQFAAGTHQLNAYYMGDGNYAATLSAASTLVVSAAPTSTTTPASTVNPLTYPGTTTLSVTVAGPGSPTGTVTFFDGATPMSGAVALTSGNATFSTTGGQLAPGGHAITAQYSGDTNHAGSTSPVLTQSVSTGTATMGAPTSSAPTSAFGTAVTFGITVGGGGTTPSGTVTFLDGATVMGTATLSAGTAALTTSALTIGTHSITVHYGGDANYGASTSPATTQTVTQDPTSTGLTAGPATTFAGQTVTFTATVGSAVGTPSGTVTFADGGVALATVTLNAAGQASISTSTLAAGAHSVTATYSGSAQYLGSAGTATATVNLYGATMATPVSSVNPSGYAGPVTFSVSVSSAGPTPTGTVTFRDNGLAVGSAVLSSGSASWTTAGLGTGSHSITASYAGDGFTAAASSAALTQTVTTAGSATALSASPSATATGQTVTLVANVTGAGSPGGSVAFSIGSTWLGSAPLNAGSASVATTTLPAGSDTVVATYSGDANHGGSSASTIVTVTPSSNTSVAAPLVSPSASTVGQTVAISATVTGTGTVTGNVTFYANGTPLGTSAVGAGGVASLSTASIPAGTSTLTAAYSGDAGHSASSSGGTPYIVSRATSSVTFGTTNPAAPAFGSTITLSVSVSGTGTPTGTVTFYDNGTPIGSSPIDGAAAATLQFTATTTGAQTFTAAYGGDVRNAPSTSGPTGLTVAPAATQLALTAADASGTTTITVTVSAANGLTPTGSVALSANGTTLGSLTVDATGTGNITVPTTTFGTGDTTIGGSYEPATADFAPARASAVLSVATTTGTSITFTGIDTLTPPPGAAGQSLVDELNVTGSGIPLIGGHNVTALPAAVLDGSRIPDIGSLSGLTPPSFGSGIAIWPFLLALTLAACAGIVVERRRWLAADAIDRDEHDQLVAGGATAQRTV